uniref:Uncharacterized protein n=1 Tax=Physcomitrium patens TaxID=3218 RepID=A0A2K1L1J4_PHYPA|nr:hypothetical protein PHYPA_002688 [Physcomitrium patens]
MLLSKKHGDQINICNMYSIARFRSYSCEPSFAESARLRPCCHLERIRVADPFQSIASFLR